MDDKLDRMFESLQRLHVSMEGMRHSLERLIEEGADHEQRLRTLERWRNNLTPILALGTFVLGAVFTTALQHWM